jgi:hypothetical protein
MTLKEKFDKISCKDCDMPYCDIKCTILNPSELNRLEQIADDFAIGFAKWITSEKSKYSILYGNQEKRFATFEKDYTPKELLEIYKKESNL